MTDIATEFHKESGEKAFDKEHRRKLNFNIGRYNENVIKGKAFYSNLELAKKRAGHIKYKAINDLEKQLIEFEARFIARGGKVLWALDAQDAIKQILLIVKKHDIKAVVKSKSMTTEELDLNEALKGKKIESLETDLGEYIVQQAGQKPYHILTPAMHMSKEDVADLFTKKFGLHANASPAEITVFVRNLLRDKFIHADAGITGANFLIADPGAIALTENEGNGLMSVSFPRVHIVIAGIEKIIPSIEDLDLFWPLLATHGTGQYITAYNSIITGPRQEGESDGPLDMYVILLDNGRTNVLAHEHQRQALSCIRCGACLNACPVYKSIGGHTYNTTYSGPIGSVITPYMENLKDFNHLSFASSLCGKCTEVCPVKIPLHELLLFNRRDAVSKGYVSFNWKTGMKMSTNLFRHRWMMDTGGGIKNILMKSFVSKMWGPRRSLPEIQPKNFKQMWEEERGKEKK
jgi:L-lactate dehydrogenase complex protein LldF